MMKRTNLLFALCLTIFFIGSTSAQDITEDNITMSLGNNNSMTVDLPFATADVAEDVWKDFVKQFGGKTRKNRRENEWFTDNAHIKDINGEENIDIHARINKIGSAASTTVWFDLGETYLSSAADPEKYDGAIDVLNEYLVLVEEAMIIIELDDEEKELGKLENDLKRLVRDLDNYNKDIAQAKDRIAKAEAGIEQNMIEQANAEKAIEKQINDVEKVKQKLSKVRKN